MITEIYKKIHTGRVESIEQAAKDLFYININVDNFSVKAGQFISILCGDLTLRRPFSVCAYKDNILTILFKLKGKGTKYISSLKKSDEINFTGAFGNGFNINNKKSLLIAAGVGVAPVNFLKNALGENGIENRFIAGFLNKESIPNKLELDKVCTDDGSIGENGSIINYIEEEILTYKPEIIYACGPAIVLKKVCEIAEKYKIIAQVAMEKEMACSIGVCRGCVIELKNGENATVCKDGPVFNGSDIKW